ncbi:olfactory receptor 4Q2 [Xenopus tropicalis]|uniref:Olfactory receptor 4Q2 n=1 Tax=Xenopus tropicalis TaxID=8364 RepID=A0A8J1JZ25_XENTR|nr:olfactory receptor 4Q2 [Xenopus tropicalis]
MRTCLYAVLCTLVSGLPQPDKVEQTPAYASALKGGHVHFNCGFVTTSSNPDLFWYVQRPGESPLFITQRNLFGKEDRVPGTKYSAKLNKENKSIDLRISGVSFKKQAMDFGNQSTVKMFFLSGFSQSLPLQVSFFVLFLVLYLITLSGNTLIMASVYMDSRLQSPMYFFLGNLSVLDICYSTVTIPKMLSNVITNSKTITFNQCMSQLFFLHMFGGTECFLLTLMAYDRYVAICNPLRYHTIINHTFCSGMVASTWLAGFLHSFTQAFLTYQLHFCGPNTINHFFCDVHPLAVLACSDTSFIDMFIIANSGMISLVCFVILLMSYIGIISTVLKMQSTERRFKAFSTCASHLMVVTLFFGPCIYIYLRPPINYSADKLISVLYTVLTPLLNPIIYTFRNHEMKSALKKILWETVLQGPRN